MTQRLFVYGTLAPGRPNAHVLEDIAGSWAEATVAGTLYPEGWGAAMGYPGIVLDGAAEEQEEVAGFLFTSRELSAHWARLDAFEGEGYERVSVKARLQDGGVVDAFIYVLKER